MGKDNDEKLSAIQAELTTLAAGIGAIRYDVDALKTAVESTSSTGQTRPGSSGFRDQACGHGRQGQTVQYRHYWTHMLLRKWFPTLGDIRIEIMRAHRVYSKARNQGATRTLIFNFASIPDRQDILRATKKNPLSTVGRSAFLRITAILP